MLYFRSEADLSNWLVKNEYPRGDTLTLAQTWQLSQLWYGDRMAEEFKGRSLEDALGIFAQVGLTGDFWSVGETAG